MNGFFHNFICIGRIESLDHVEENWRAIWEGSMVGMGFEIAGRCANCVAKSPGKQENGFVCLY